MSSIAVLRNERAVQDDFLGPALVVRVLPEHVEVRLSTGQVVQARSALSFPYQLADADEILVLGKGGDYYAIGVLHFAGPARLTFPGDLDLNAVNGALSLSASKGIDIRTSLLTVQADRLRTIAESVVQKFSTVHQRIHDLLSLHVGQTHTVVEDTSYTQAKRTTILSEESVNINGKEVFLG